MVSLHDFPGDKCTSAHGASVVLLYQYFFFFLNLQLPYILKLLLEHMHHVELADPAGS